MAVAASANSDLLAAAVDGGPAAVFVTDGEARFLAANVAACDLVGYSLDELLELRVPAIAPVGDEPAVEEMFADLVRDGEQNGLTPIRNRNGSIILVRYYAQQVGADALYVALVVPRRTLGAQSDALQPPRSRDRTRLSTREFEILALLAEGLENDDIARSLHLAPDTVKAHVSKVLQKLGARSRTHAVALALRGGLID
jgi:PAS domain S-box-containing protein